jgi:hypothetical protein
MTQDKTAKPEQQQAPEGQVSQSGENRDFNPMDPQVDPAMASREQVSATVDPERPYVGGQQDPYAEDRDPVTGQIAAEKTAHQGEEKSGKK